MKYLFILFLLFPITANAAMIHDANETPQGWDFNYANTPALKEKVLFNLFIPKCQKNKESLECAKTQTDARSLADKKAAAIVKIMTVKKPQ